MAETRNRGAQKRKGEQVARCVLAAEPGELGRLVRRLGDLGLSERAVLSCFGVRCALHARARARVPAPAEPSPAAVLPLLFAARRSVPIEIARRRLGADLDALEELGLVEREADRVRATCTLLPVGESLAFGSGDDSTFHLIGALPQRRVRAWHDVGTGNALIPLGRRGLAARVLATDVDRRALLFARVGVALSGADEIEVQSADLLGAAAPAPWPLITFNAPIPDTEDGAPLIDRFWQQARRVIAEDGEVIVHSRQDRRDYPACLDLPGCTVAVRYTPDATSPAFGVTIWRPAGASRCELVAIELTRDQPHVRREHFHLED